MRKLMLLSWCLIVIVVLISNIYFALIIFDRNIRNNAYLLWGSSLLEEKIKIPLLTESGDIKEKSLDPTSLEVASSKTREIGRAEGSPDIAKISQKRLIGPFIDTFESSMGSVKDWKVEVEERRMGFTRSLADIIIGYFSLPQAGYVLGFVFGNDDLMSDEVRHYLKITGMSHVASASGYNISLLLGLITPGISRFWSRRRATAFFVWSIWFYIWLAGSSPSLLRAGCMATLALLGGRLLYAQSHPSRLLMVTVVFFYLVLPEVATSLSFQLSASATLGLIWFMPVLSQGSNLALALMGLTGSISVVLVVTSRLKAVINLISEAFLTTLAAQAFTMPLLWHHFQEFSLISLVSNTFLLWLTPIITVMSSFGVIVAVITQVWSGFSPAMVAISWINGIWIELFTRGLTFFGQYEAGLLSLPELPWKWVLIWWGGGWCLSWKLSQHLYISQNRRLGELYGL